MATTLGTWALRDAKPKKNAAVADKLLEAGMIIIGRESLSGQSPYVHGGVLLNATFLGHSARYLCL
ncbi:hypothetical protein BKA61DRAFT_675002 [Leptodontidium sp. MPI-SDFR-AT-0119]|nr:hypothetical protein BKA61DRAFT_675002 [Leptodontidium sp. MPI-SDFR-AT-0119]